MTSSNLLSNVWLSARIPQTHVNMDINATNVTNNGNAILDRWTLYYDKYLPVRNIWLGAFGIFMNIVALILIQTKTDMKMAARIKISSLIITDLAIVVSTALYGITSVVQSSISTCWLVSFTFVLLHTASHSTVTMISILNCIAVCYPVYFRVSMTPARVALTLVGMWIIVVALALCCVGFGIHGDDRCLPLGLLPTHGLLLFLSITGTCDLFSISLTIMICWKLRGHRRIMDVHEVRHRVSNVRESFHRATNVHEVLNQPTSCLPKLFQMRFSRTREYNTGPESSPIRADNCQAMVKHQQEIQTKGECLLKKEDNANLSKVNRSTVCGCTLSVSTTKRKNVDGAIGYPQNTQDRNKNGDESYACEDTLEGTKSQRNTRNGSDYWAVKPVERSSEAENRDNNLHLQQTATETKKDDVGPSLKVVTRKWGMNSIVVLKWRSIFQDSEGKTLSQDCVHCRKNVTNGIEMTSFKVESSPGSEIGHGVGKDALTYAFPSTSIFSTSQGADNSPANEIKHGSLASDESSSTWGCDRGTSHSPMCLAVSNLEPHSPTRQGNFRTAIYTNRSTHTEDEGHSRCQINPDTIFSNPRPPLRNDSLFRNRNNSSLPMSSNQLETRAVSHKVPRSRSLKPAAEDITNTTSSSDQQYVNVKVSLTSRRIISTLTFLTMWSGTIHFVSLLILLWMVIFEKDKKAFLVSTPGLVSSTLILFNALSNPVIYVWSLTKWKTLYRKIRNTCTKA